MKKKIYLAGLAAGILLAMLPAGTVKASEKQTTEEYYYQLLLSGAYPYNTAANAGGLNTAAGSWEQIVALANQQLNQAVARQQALQAERQNMEAQLQAAGQAVAQAQAALTAAQQAYAAAQQAALYSQQAAILNQQAAQLNQQAVLMNQQAANQQMLLNPQYPYLQAGTPQTVVPALTTELIVKVQNLLTLYGCSCAPTGIYDVQTQAALIQFQTKYGLVVDGTINAQVLQLFGLVM
ncbi:peptidoglycan-binding domain-containing protein [Eisenbergiella porci]|uniref:peptidoglycan-binding domain-containing protein n=1 Tax=Eisenbergiella porci TaxID=2652274 RepID=UPI002A805E4E|nr:peptidoglycan-binding domain-containing protein [Eisenbergiella porci]